MIKRTIEISQRPAHVAVRLDQLRLERGANGETDPDTPSIPCEDIGVLLVDHPSTTYTHAALTRLLEHGAAVVLCGRNHLPAGLLLPVGEHSEIVWRVNDQLALTKPRRKQLWQQIVVAKIAAQAAALAGDHADAARRLRGLARRVRSGDPDNVEATAARAYWAAWRREIPAFRRDPDASDANALLNYGYAVMRAAVARALVAAGLLPALGLKHANRSNAFCLADDLVEPLRPLVDARTRTLWRQGATQLDQPTKAPLLELLTATVRVGDHTGPLMVGLHRTVASLIRCYRGQDKRLLLPVAVEDES